MTRDAYRFSREPEGSEMDIWDRAVARLLGPVITESDRERRCADALALAAAALRAPAQTTWPPKPCSATPFEQASQPRNNEQ